MKKVALKLHSDQMPFIHGAWSQCKQTREFNALGRIFELSGLRPSAAFLLSPHKVQPLNDLMSTHIRAIVFDPENRYWLHFKDPLCVYSASTVDRVIETLDQVERSCLDDTVWAVGWISYEAAPAFDQSMTVREETTFPTIWFATFSEPTITQELPETKQPSPLSWRPSITKDEYIDAVQEVRSAIARGDTYQVNYSFRLHSSFAPDPLALFATMVRNQGGDYSWFVDTGDYVIASASPELFFSKNGDVITSRPMKGTSPRGRTLTEDFALAEDLRTSPKNRAENIMIVDMTRNDLSRVAERGSVSTPSCCTIEKYPHMLQMTSEVRATSHASLTELIQAFFPAASITGAPKTETMKIIAERETTPRKIYTGTLGVISPHDRAWFNVAIRTALLDRARNVTEYGIGSGIVWDSQSDLEYDECLNKATAVTRSTPPFELFETILWEPDSGFFLLEEHLSRITDGADYLSWPLNPEDVMSRLDQVAQQCATTAQSHRVRVYASKNGSLRHDLTPLTALPSCYRLSPAKEPIASNDPSLFRKTTDRRTYDLAIPRDGDAADVILWNERGEITETKIANICLELDGVLYTPPVTSGLLPGCYRDHLIKKGSIIERTLTLADLHRATRIVLVNSLRRAWDAELIRSDLRVVPAVSSF